MTCPTVSDGPAICRMRGDTFPWTFTIKNQAGTVINIDNYAFRLTVDADEDPPDASNNLFELTGNITDPVNGIVEFELDATEADQEPEKYYYDLEWVDAASKIRTIAKSIFQFKQDISK